MYYVTSRRGGRCVLREGRLIPDAFRKYRDLLDFPCESSKCYTFLCTPGFLLDDALQLWQ